MSSNSIHVVALVCWRDDRLLVVKKHGHYTWFQPGGKPECGEGLETALRRELLEELRVGLEDVAYIGRVETMAANEPDTRLIADLFSANLIGELQIQAEISHAAWMSSDELRLAPVAPLILEHVLSLRE